MTKAACLLRRDAVKAVAPPKAKVHIHRGTMVAAGMTGADTTNTAAVVNAKDNGTAGNAQMPGRKVTKVSLGTSSSTG